MPMNDAAEPRPPIDPARLAVPGGWRIEVEEATPSTNAALAERARAGEEPGFVLFTEHQTAGRGRRDRRWEAPPGSSLLLSVLTRPTALGLADDEVHLVPTALGVAAAEAARDVTGADIRLKWPNDLVVTDADGVTRKLAGLLAETVVDAGHVAALVVGLGINVNWPDRLPAGLAGTATALNHLTGADVDRSALLGALLVGFDRGYGGLGAPGSRVALGARHRELSATIGRRVRVETPAGVVVGDAVDVDGEGRLLVVDECPDRPRALSVGDVVHLRPEPRA